MSPTCSKAAMRALISIMLATSIANAAALPHQVLDARDAAPVQNAQLAAEAIQAAASAAAENPSNFFEDISDELNNRTAWEVFRDFFTRLFGPREDDNEPPAVTITVTPTPEDSFSPASSAIEIIIPAGPSATPTEVVVSIFPSTTPAPASESEIIMSILPVGDLSSAINATFPTPIFVTDSETPSAIETPAPFPVFNATSNYGPLLTAASITGMFSTNPLVTGILLPANSSLPSGTGIALPVETTLPVVNETVPLVNVTVPLVNVTAPLVNVTESLTDNVTSTTVVIVTETVTPVPISIGTGTAPAISAGTGLPIIIVGSPLWPNASYGEPTAVVLPIGTGTGVPLGTAISIPLGTAITAILPVETALSNGTGLPNGTGVSYGTGIPLSTGTGGLPVGTDLPIAVSPLFPNTTYPSGPTAAILPIPILLTGVPEPVLVNFTVPASNITSTAGAVEESITQFPVTVTGIPGSNVAITVAIPDAPYSNTTAIESAVAPIATTEVSVSVGTGLPIPSLAADVSAPYSNTTILVVPVETANPVLILPIETPEVDAGTLNVTIALPTAGYGRK